MKTSRENDVFAGVDAHTLEKYPWVRPPESSFETMRGLLTAAVLGLPLWAAVLMLFFWIWS